MIAGSFGVYSAKTARDHEESPGGAVTPRGPDAWRVTSAPRSAAGLGFTLIVSSPAMPPGLVARLEPRTAAGSPSATAVPPVPEAYCMAAATMSLEQHGNGRGIHAVRTGAPRDGQRLLG